MSDTFVPPAITQFMDDIEDHIGQRPRLVSPQSRRWEVRLEGEHVLATCNVRLRAMDGRVQFRSGVLEVDGVGRATARNLTELRSIWKRYELGEITDVPEIPAWTGPDDQVPAAVLKVHEKLAAESMDEHGELRYRPVLSLHEGLWYVGIDSVGDEHACVRIAYNRVEGTPPTVWMPDPAHSLLVRDGIRTQIGSVAELTHMLMEMVNAHKARPASSSTGPIQHGSTTTPGKANSVATRRATVFRV